MNMIRNRLKEVRNADKIGVGLQRGINVWLVMHVRYVAVKGLRYKC